ncbi:hypothetical protein [Acinetobacter sp. NCu2D-2]|uniref:hypothetical protein n=1 Tax=Acinetobacter sp. NCu2D-2 TaxID=1608473 RepID=UPI000A5F4CEF|nr:hypothetical protein [Acinetobacter sp. NCu2D-2]
MDQYIGELICALLGFLGGMTATVCYQKITKTDSSKNEVKQRNLRSGGGDIAGRDIKK